MEADKSYNGFLDTLKTRIKINYTGSVEWLSPITFRINCGIKVAKFPFDTQTCDFRFGSWTYDDRKLKLVSDKPSAETKEYTGKKIYQIPVKNNTTHSPNTYLSMYAYCGPLAMFTLYRIVKRSVAETDPVKCEQEQDLC